MIRTFLTVLLLVVTTAAHAEAPAQFAAPGLRAPDDPDVNGVRFSVIHGTNRSMRGLDLGMIAVSESSTLSGFRSVVGMSRLTGDMTGCDASLINIHSGSDTGLNAAFINRVRTMQHGANVGFVNIADGYTMADVGGLNISNRSIVQVGFLNVTTTLKGVQIGFLNVAENGFLPVFPFFNFPKN